MKISYEAWSSEQLLESAGRRGGGEPLRILLLREGAPVKGYIRREAPPERNQDELYQEVWTRAVKRVRAGERPEGGVRLWVLGMAREVCEHRRKHAG